MRRTMKKGVIIAIQGLLLLAPSGVYAEEGTKALPNFELLEIREGQLPREAVIRRDGETFEVKPGTKIDRFDVEVTQVLPDKVVLLFFEEQFDGRRSPRFLDVSLASRGTDSPNGEGQLKNSQFFEVGKRQLRLISISNEHAEFVDRAGGSLLVRAGDELFSPDVRVIGITESSVTLREIVRSRNFGTTSRTIRIEIDPRKKGAVS